MERGGTSIIVASINSTGTIDPFISTDKRTTHQTVYPVNKYESAYDHPLSRARARYVFNVVDRAVCRESHSSSKCLILESSYYGPNTITTILGIKQSPAYYEV